MYKSVDVDLTSVDSIRITIEEKEPEVIDIMFLMDRFGYAKTVDIPTYERNKDSIESEYKYIIPEINFKSISF